MKIVEIHKLAKKITDEVLDLGMGVSTWQEHYPEAFDNLLGYRLDIEDQIAQILMKNLRKEN